jgi:hypothetical protein
VISDVAKPSGLSLHDARIEQGTHFGSVDHALHLDVAGLSVDLDAGAANHPERGTFWERRDFEIGASDN